MFSNLRQGSNVFVLHKNNAPFVESGVVESVSNLSMFAYPSMPTIPVDLTIRIGEKVMTYRQLPASADSANVIAQGTGEEVVIACTKDAVNAEVQAMRQKSIDIINSKQYHEQRIAACDALLAQLNPEQVQQAKQQQKIQDLEGQVNSLTLMIEKLTSQLEASSQTKS